MSEFFIGRESKTYLLIQNLKNKADKACIDRDRAACCRWVYQLLDILDTGLPEVAALPLAIAAVDDSSASMSRAPLLLR